MLFYKTKTLRKLNQCRMYLKIFCLADIVELDGVTIQPSIWNCVYPAASTYNWPTIPRPTASLIKLWQKALRFCFSINKQSILMPLGKWLPVIRHIQYPIRWDPIDNNIHCGLSPTYCHHPKNDLRHSYNWAYTTKDTYNPNNHIPVGITPYPPTHYKLTHKPQPHPKFKETTASVQTQQPAHQQLIKTIKQKDTLTKALIGNLQNTSDHSIAQAYTNNQLVCACDGSKKDNNIGYGYVLYSHDKGDIGQSDNACWSHPDLISSTQPEAFGALALTELFLCIE